MLGRNYHRRSLVVGGEIAQEEEGQHVVAKVVSIHRTAQLIGDAPEGVAQLFLVLFSHVFSSMDWAVAAASSHAQNRPKNE